ncbi:sodium- and chloride-dependent GABA transporter ine-like isoform X2 [Ornithodoros turicata]|uniref:sodium- and chloride-dependent GABA transporter ine-like isoform X2 n=1 Tax=Ornithodoros turicata TaxID=34597 RepID=UPI003139E139
MEPADMYSAMGLSKGQFDSLGPIILIPTSAGLVPGIPTVVGGDQVPGTPTQVVFQPIPQQVSDSDVPVDLPSVDGLEEAAKYYRSFSCGEEVSNLAVQVTRRLSRSVPELRQQPLPHSRADDYYYDSSSDEEHVSEAPKAKSKENRWLHYLDLVAGCTREAVGLANIWRFPYFCFMHGGGVGLAGVATSFVMTSLYSVIFSWAIFYFFNSFHGDPRWAKCANSWNTKQCCEDPDTLILSLYGGFHNPNANFEPGKLTFPNVTRAPATVSPNGTTPGFRIPDLEVDLTQRPDLDESDADDQSWVSYTLSRRMTTAQEFFDHKLLEISKAIDSPGEVRWELLASVALCLCLMYVSLRKDTFFSGRIKYVLSLAPLLILFAFLLRVVMLPGAKEGIVYLFQPNVQAIKSAWLWIFALAQTIHSLGLTLGSNYVISSKNKKQITLMRDTVISVFVNTVTVIVVGCVVFGMIGHICVRWRQRIDGTFFHKDPGLVFVIYSEVIRCMPVPSFWAITFFFFLICMAMDSQVTIGSSMVQALEEAYGRFIKQRFQGHGLFLLFICAACFITCVPCITQGGIYYFQLTDYYVAVLAVIVISFSELCALGWFYGGHNLLSTQNEIMHHVPYIYLRICWGLLTPLVFVAVMVCGGMSLSRLRYRDRHHFPMWADIVGWVLFGLIVSIVPVFMCRAVFQAESPGLVSKVREALEPQLEVEQPLDYWEPKPLVVINNPKDGISRHTTVVRDSRRMHNRSVYYDETDI